MLKDFLDNKPLFYDEIDYTRMPMVYEKVKHHFKKIKTIHLIGTNGKGTTGRFLASALHSLGFKTGHYTSPHILEFNERIWLDGDNVDDEVLESAYIKLENILNKEDADALSYFEYTTLLAMFIFNDCDFIVLEAGLGGEHDATAVFDKSLTLVLPIDFDHEAFLGNDINAIATTKLNAIQNSAIIASQKHDEVNYVARKTAKDKSLNIYTKEHFLDSSDKENIKLISSKLTLAPYLEENLSLAIAALKFFDVNYDINNFDNSRLFGRLSNISKNIIVDVGHNPLAASSIVQSLSPNKYILVYNSYQDKNYKKILQILKVIIKHVEIINIDNQRLESLELMQNTLQDLDIKYKIFEKTKEDEQYLVFGSFSVVEEFLKR